MLTPETRLKDRYRILERIGGGGFGHVYKAIDEVFGCCVAVKETREEVALVEKMQKAFEREAKLLRNLKHDCLPRVTDYFFESGAQFLVMDFIEGEDLGALLRKRLQAQRPLTLNEVLPWADKILSALEYLHGCPEPIVHRDIKPANIKLADEGGIYLLDFGLAKGATGQMSTVVEGQSSFSVAAFTHEYAPLEQLQNTGTQPQSDIYSFGATLYHLLTGKCPLSASQRDEAIQRSLGDPLRVAHEVNPAVPPTVSKVISRAMAIRWWDRIESASEMRTALARATNQAVEPLPMPAPVDISIPPTPLSADADGQSTLQLPNKSGFKAPADSAPAESPKGPGTNRHGRVWLIAGLALTLLALSALGLRRTFPGWFGVASAKPDATSAAVAPKTPVLTPSDLHVVHSLTGHSKTVWSVAFASNGSLAASGSQDGNIILWDTATWLPKFPTLTGHRGEVYSVAFSPDGRILASGSHDKTIRLWDTQSGKFMRELPQEHTKPVLRLAFSPDGELLASISGEQETGDKEIRLWNVRNGWKSIALKGHEDAVIALAFSANGATLASSSYDNTLRLWYPRANGPAEVLKRYDSPLMALAFSSDGHYLACGSSDNQIKLWTYEPQTQKWKEQKPLEAHKGFITAIGFSPDNRTLVSASADETIRLWDLASGPSSIPLLVRQGEIKAPQGTQRPDGTTNSVAFSPDGQTLMAGGQDKTIRIWQ